MGLRLFVRQSFTQAGEAEQGIVQDVIKTILTLEQLPKRPFIVTGEHAQSAESFRAHFESNSALPFSPRAFREHRLSLLKSADAMIIVRTGLSESSAFEIAYNLYGGPKIPMFFAVWKQAPIKTTLLQDLQDLCLVCYQNFDNVVELREPLSHFLRRLPCRVNSGAEDFPRI